MINRQEAVGALASMLGDELVVTSLGIATNDLYTARDRPLTTAPLGASEPVSTLIPPSEWIGASRGWTTTPSGPGGSISARFSAIVLPVTVMTSPCR